MSAKLNRRKFLQTSVKGSLAAAALGSTSFRSAEIIQKEEIKIREYRRLGRTNFEVSDISMGAGGLTNAPVLEAALDMGLNYIDTAEHYMRGQSEQAVGDVIKNRKRDSLFITTKLNLDFFGGTSKKELRERFDKCYERLQTDYIDCLMIHMAQSPEQIKHKDFHKMAEELKKEGKIRFIGLSNHGPEHKMAGNLKEPMEKVLLAAAEDGRFDVALFVYNFIQKEQGERILESCKKADMGITLMKVNPINFYNSIQGSLERARSRNSDNLHEIEASVKEYEALIERGSVFRQKYGLDSDQKVRDAAIKFVIGNKDVHTVCPSINNFGDLETFASLSGTRLESTEPEMLADYSSSLGKNYCRHACGICEDACPDLIPVNTVMRYNHYFESQGRERIAMEKFAALDIDINKACQDCSGYCMQKCPYDVPVKPLLLHAAANLRI